MNLSLKGILEYTMAILIIFSHSMYTYTENNSVNYAIKVMLSILPVIYFIACSPYCKIKIRHLNIVILYYVGALIYLIVSVSSNGFASYFFRFLLYLPMMIVIFANQVNAKNILKALSNVTIFFAITGLILWVLVNLLHVIQPTSYLYTTWNIGYRPVYFGIYSEVYAPIFRTGINRNCSMFGEATVFGYFLCSALLYEKFLDKGKKWKNTVLILAGLTTMSTSTLLIIIYAEIMSLWNVMKNNQKYRQLKWLLLIGPFVCGAGVIYSMLTNSTKQASISIRMSDYVNGLNAWRNAPIVGNGYQTELNAVYNTGFSNSISLILSSGGLIFAMIFLVPSIIIIFRRFTRNDYVDIGNYAVGMLLLFCILIIAYTYNNLIVLAFEYSILCKDRVRGSKSDLKLKSIIHK